MKVSFPRGIHPPHFKDTALLPIVKVEPEKGCLLVYPMVQHIGAPCKPLAEVGDTVLAGQKIGDTDARLSAPVLSAVSGVVKSVGEKIVIENDGNYTLTRWAKADYTSLSAEEILRRIQGAGIVGLGGAGFPTHVKLGPPPDKKIDRILVNAAECEPFLTTDHRVMLEYTDDVLTGLKVVLHMFPEAKGIIAVEDNKPDVIKILTEANKSDRISIVTLAAKYPQGGEKQLIFACTGREVPSGALPMDMGCIVQNVSTVAAVNKAVNEGQPLIRKVVTLAGGAASKPGNYQVPLGMKFKDLVKAVGGLKSEPYKIVVGGPMMGVSIPSLDAPVIKTTSGLLLLTEEEAKKPPEENCFRCGKCVAACPIGLVPVDLNRTAIKKNPLFVKFNGMDCILCASCSYICPAHRDIAKSINDMRQELGNIQKLMTG